MKSKQLKWWIIGIVITPFALMLCLHISIALQQYFKFNINVPNIEAADWFMFAGSYLGGAMTLIGVVATLQHERKIHQHQLQIESIENEKEHLNRIISAIDLHAPMTYYLQFMAVTGTSILDKLSAYTLVRKNIVEQLSILKRLTTEMQLSIGISNSADEYNATESINELVNIKNKLLKQYMGIHKQLYSSLSNLDSLVESTHNDTVQLELINLYSEEIKEALEEGRTPIHTQKDIDSIYSNRIEIEPTKEKVLDDITATAKLAKSELPQLITDTRTYINLRIKDAEIHCFGKK